jgi:hypothetical protein
MDTRQQLEAFKKEAADLLREIRKWRKSKENDPGPLNLCYSLFMRQKDTIATRFPGNNFSSLFREMKRQFKFAMFTHQASEMSDRLKSNPETFLAETSKCNQLIADMRPLTKSSDKNVAKKMQKMLTEFEASVNKAENILIKKIDKANFQRTVDVIKAFNGELSKEREFDIDFLEKVKTAIEKAEKKLVNCQLKYGQWGAKLGKALQDELATLKELQSQAFTALCERRKGLLETSDSETLATDTPSPQTVRFTKM